MSRILIAGGFGFIGSNFVRSLLQSGNVETCVVDNFGFAARESNLSDLADDIRVERADIAADFDSILDVFEDFGPEYVVNFAAESHNDRAIKDPSLFAHANAIGAQSMVEASRRTSVARHLHVSTIEVYGELPPGTGAFNESSPLNAKTPYSAAKAAGDIMVRSYMHTYPELDIMMTHCANNYGPYQLPEKLIPLAITNLLSGRKVGLYGDGKQRRDWIHVDDHNQVILDLLQSKRPVIADDAATNPSGLPIFDISARCEVTNLEIVTRICTELGLDPDDWIEFVADRPNHDRRYLIDPKKTESFLDWSPAIEFEDGLAQTVQWYRDNEPWWREDVSSGALITRW